MWKGVRIRENKNRKKWIRKNCVRCGMERLNSDKGGFGGKINKVYSILIVCQWVACATLKLTHNHNSFELIRATASGCCLWHSYSLFSLVAHPSLRFLLVHCCDVMCLRIPLLSKFFVFSAFFLLRFHCYRFDCTDLVGACVCVVAFPHYFY